MSYARGTEVPVEKSRIAIECLLQRHGVVKVGVLQEPGFATVFFATKEGWEVQMRIPIPTDEDAKKVTRNGWALTEVARRSWVEQRVRERWRQLLLVLKAKFTALENGVETFEQLFMAHLVLGGQPVGERLLPAIRAAQEMGTPLQLAAGTATRHGPPGGAP